MHLCEDMGYIIADQRMNSDQDRYTYTSEAHNTCNWIDLIVCTQSACNMISAVKVDSSAMSSDHYIIISLYLQYICLTGLIHQIATLDPKYPDDIIDNCIAIMPCSHLGDSVHDCR